MSKAGCVNDGLNVIYEPLSGAVVTLPLASGCRVELSLYRPKTTGCSVLSFSKCVQSIQGTDGIPAHSTKALRPAEGHSSKELILQGSSAALLQGEVNRAAKVAPCSCILSSLAAGGG